jgi:hypothetical protein
MVEPEAWVQALRVDFTVFLYSGGIDRFEVKMVERNLGPQGGGELNPPVWYVLHKCRILFVLSVDIEPYLWKNASFYALSVVVDNVEYI